MNEINSVEDKKELELELDKKETPLSVRVDSYYKDLFLELSERPGFSRKRLLESMISTYIRREKEESRQNNLNLENEISLISGSLEDILKVFKTISIKAQDTIGSARGLYKQQIENLKKNNEALELKIQAAEEEGKRLAIHNKELELNIKEISEENKDLTDKIRYLQEELKKAKAAHSAALEEVYNLRRIEGENVKLINENKELLVELEKNKAIINKKEKEIEKLNYDFEMFEHKKGKEIEVLKRELELQKEETKLLRESKEAEIKDIEKLIRREIELQKEAELLTLKQEYNNLQIQYIKDIGSLRSHK